MKNWIKRHSDTSITVSENNKFYSQGSQIGFAEQVYLSSDMTMFIEIDNQLYIDSTFHHDKDWHLWTYDKLGIKDILVGIKQLEENTLINKTYLKHRREKQHSMIINTRWSATNYFHWIIKLF